MRACVAVVVLLAGCSVLTFDGLVFDIEHDAGTPAGADAFRIGDERESGDAERSDVGPLRDATQLGPDDGGDIDDAEQLSDVGPRVDAGDGCMCFNGHGSTSCIDGACMPVCEAPWLSCDGAGWNGCETRAPDGCP